MNGHTSKIIKLYAKATNKDAQDVKDWWKSLSDKDRCKSRRDMLTIGSEYKVSLRKATEAKKSIPEGGDCS